MSSSAAREAARNEQTGRSTSRYRRIGMGLRRHRMDDSQVEQMAMTDSDDALKRTVEERMRPHTIGQMGTVDPEESERWLTEEDAVSVAVAMIEEERQHTREFGHSMDMAIERAEAAEKALAEKSGCCACCDEDFCDGCR